jgi:hypothetical protein
VYVRILQLYVRKLVLRIETRFSTVRMNIVVADVCT